MKPAEKHFRCAVCQRGFSRIDHLKRHHLRHPNSTSLEFFQDTLLGFFNGPFGEGQKPMEDTPTGQIAYTIPIPCRQDPNLAISPEQQIFEPERPFTMALIQSIAARAWTVPLDAKAQGEISANLNFLLTTARVRKLVAFYFKYWQPSCAMIHFPSFDLETVALPLLAAMVFMGAMYSADQREVYAAKRVLDFAELYIFSSHAFSPESEVATVFSGRPSADNEGDDWTKFQHFLAGFIITIVQYWAGCRPSRDRVMENRFSEVVKVSEHAVRVCILSSRYRKAGSAPGPYKVLPYTR
ncbi:uncharacterized protein N7459_001645 [Penicillium hispanicum]|uniref:uncharacterized protein n=1 Tax=Penicillium hispanicum TaxID=1080232 RepID=UPI00253FCC40|nr:uncharacterized protein N7459_001645 [Penicillium hispanicum]KAJ5595437.1 hypothetical protein N7459_001645 [Penicillium hispanicum]